MNKAFFYYTMNGDITREVVSVLETENGKSLIVDCEGTVFPVPTETLEFI